MKSKRIRESEVLQISLAAARVNARMTQAAAAKKMHVSKNKIVNWENGKQEPTVSQAKGLSELYGIPLDNIFLPATSN